MSNFRTLHVGLNDVYDFAYFIAQDFEKIVLFCDIDVLKPVIDKVINVLEILETSIQRIEQLEAEVQNLKSNNLHLNSEKLLSDHEKCKLKQIYEESEESWLEEVMNLKSQLSALKSEKESLKIHLAEEKDHCSNPDDKLNDVIQEQAEVINKLKYIVKQKEKMLQDNFSTISSLDSRIQELLKMNKILHMKHQEARSDISQLIVEKNELLHKSLCIEKSEENVSSNKSIEYTFEEPQTGMTRCHLHEETVLQEKIKKLQSELQNLRMKSKHHEAIVSTLNSNESTVPLSKIHQLFHLFLGFTTLSGFSWF